jgi:hypothetical protein
VRRNADADRGGFTGHEQPKRPWTGNDAVMRTVGGRKPRRDATDAASLKKQNRGEQHEAGGRQRAQGEVAQRYTL